MLECFYLWFPISVSVCLNPFIGLLLAKCIDHYTKLRVENAELPEDEEKKSIDPRLEGIVNKMFLRCLDDHKYKQAIGIALETRRLDMFEKTILESVSIYSPSVLFCDIHIYCLNHQNSSGGCKMTQDSAVLMKDPDIFSLPVCRMMSVASLLIV